MTVFDILVELNVAAIIVITRAVLPGVIPTAILSALAVESVSVASEKAPVVFAPIENVSKTDCYPDLRDRTRSLYTRTSYKALVSPSMENEKGDIHISTVQGNVSGIISGGTGNIAGKYVVVGSGTINVSEQQLARIQNNDYAQSLRDFSENINKQLKDRQIPEEQIKSINQSMDELAKEVEDIQPGKDQEIDYVKQTNVEAKTASVIQKVLNVLPQVPETAVTFTPLAPISKLIGKGVQEIVNAINRRKGSS